MCGPVFSNLISVSKTEELTLVRFRCLLEKEGAPIECGDIVLRNADAECLGKMLLAKPVKPAEKPPEDAEKA